MRNTSEFTSFLKHNGILMLSVYHSLNIRTLNFRINLLKKHDLNLHCFGYFIFLIPGIIVMHTPHMQTANHSVLKPLGHPLACL